jgi:hypothetical protein
MGFSLFCLFWFIRQLRPFVAHYDSEDGILVTTGHREDRLRKDEFVEEFVVTFE